MNKATIMGMIISFLGLIGFITAMSIGSHFPIHQWPYQVFQGIAFSLSFGLGLPVIISYTVTCVLFFIVASVFFMLGAKLSHCLFRTK
ncbi:hypothetical protein PVK62_02280 [Aliivibrio sp. S3MY1]|uniref:hypothetical protein n=1 Tax=unclassified Aliivibrio TaxID=2645654 RepID=UPI00237949DA|nr:MULTISPECIES: hypothetical protein [unclassified Aliivibrio]MDD9194661.1 hypothetical protein [Aliivibrio sp. S3MY1]MDD9198499.1 hypothetical protein [Aliivibrio sp. S2MY1]